MTDLLPLALVATAALIATLTVSPAARGFVRDQHAAVAQAWHDATHRPADPSATSVEQRRRAQLHDLWAYEELVARANDAVRFDGVLPFSDDLA